MGIPCWRYVEYVDDGCSRYQCLSCKQEWVARSNPRHEKWRYCPACGVEWAGERECRERGEPAWLWRLLQKDQVRWNAWWQKRRLGQSRKTRGWAIQKRCLQTRHYQEGRSLTAWTPWYVERRESDYGVTTLHDVVSELWRCRRLESSAPGEPARVEYRAVVIDFHDHTHPGSISRGLCEGKSLVETWERGKKSCTS